MDDGDNGEDDDDEEETTTEGGATEAGKKAKAAKVVKQDTEDVLAYGNVVSIFEHFLSHAGRYKGRGAATL